MQPNDIVVAVFEFVLLIFSLSVHECAHAWMASRLGDQTARLQGRITLNPIPHIDPIGTLLFPALMIVGSMFGYGGFLIGWAKPTPVITRNFKKIVRDDNLVTLAGPASNLLLALGGFLGLVIIILTTRSVPVHHTLDSSVDALSALCDLGIQVNLALFVFNLLPIPPLDGSHILRNFLPYKMAAAFDQIGILSYLLMFFVGSAVINVVMPPAMHLVYAALTRIQGA